MLDLKYETISPYLRDRSRLIALSSGSNFGEFELSPEHLVERLNSVIGNFNNERAFTHYDVLKRREYPELSRERVIGNHNVSSDILLKDTFRQHRGIEERYRKFLPNLRDIRAIGDPSTKYHIASSRGFERHLIDHINRLDAEKIDRSSIRPFYTNNNISKNNGK